MVLQDDINKTLRSMILSVSGWRGVFAADGNEESSTEKISDAHRIIAAAAARVFVDFLQSHGEPAKPLVLLGSDTRPTGTALAQAIICSLTAVNCEVKWAGFVAAPEIMAWAERSGAKHEQKRPVGFIYISASHNPIGHNGLKFGLSDGGILSPEKAAILITQFNSLMAEPDCALRIEKAIANADTGLKDAIYSGETQAKAEAFDSYFDFITAVAWASADNTQTNTPDHILSVTKFGLKKNPLGLVCDFNGSARCSSIDRKFFSTLGLGFKAIHEKAGEIAHRIVPEGESLVPCMKFLEETHSRDSSFILGYTPDCDGDRGNLVIWDQSFNNARILEAQEVFALACIAELSQLVWTGELAYTSRNRASTRSAIAVNDPTSLRIDRIASAFDVSIFRAETGEANVVGLARKLRTDGYRVRILGEGSAGGNITHPQAVRDPLNTVLALVKLLTIRSTNGKPGLFEIWCNKSHQNALYHENFTLDEIIASLPPFITTAAYDEKAILKVKTTDHSLLKDRYQSIFLREWNRQKEAWGTRYGIYTWEATAYNGMEEKRGIERFAEAGKGGLKICFSNRYDRIIASIWMRGSATEPVFRVMADVEGQDKQMEQELIEWQRRMVREADAGQGVEHGSTGRNIFKKDNPA